jgi:hypothetical protein
MFEEKVLKLYGRNPGRGDFYVGNIGMGVKVCIEVCAVGDWNDRGFDAVLVKDLRNVEG